MVHSEQSSQYASCDWQSILREKGLEGRIHRQRKCCDDAVDESFFELLKGEQVRRHVHSIREEAHCDVFEYLEVLNNARLRSGFNNQPPPAKYEERYEKQLSSGYKVEWDSV